MSHLRVILAACDAIVAFLTFFFGTIRPMAKTRMPTLRKGAIIALLLFASVWMGLVGWITLGWLGGSPVLVRVTAAVAVGLLAIGLGWYAHQHKKLAGSH